METTRRDGGGRVHKEGSHQLGALVFDSVHLGGHTQLVRTSRHDSVDGVVAVSHLSKVAGPKGLLVLKVPQLASLQSFFHLKVVLRERIRG